MLLQLERAIRSGQSSTLLGGRKSGKSFLARGIARRLSPDLLVIPIDLERMALTPENFSVEFMCAAARLGLPKKMGAHSFLDLPSLLSLQKEMGADAFSILSAVDNELQKIKPNQLQVIRLAFQFASALALSLKKKAAVIVDNAEHILDFNNFPQIKDIFSCIPLADKSITFLFASSASTQMRKQAGLEHFSIPPLEEHEIEALVRKQFLGVEKNALKEIVRLCGGNPLIAEILGKRMANAKSPAHAFAIELLAKEGVLHRFAEDSFRYYYSQARGQTLITLLLRVVARQELRLSEIARKIYRSAPIAKSMLERLIAVDAIEKRGKTFFVTDPVLRMWLKAMAEGREVEHCSDVDEKTAQEFAREIIKGP